jgi:pimeloyl-ACP methyl ester carboxylesterase
MPRQAMGLLGWRLAGCGFRPLLFGYPSLWANPRQNAERLHRWIQALDVPRLHLLAHSLGGLLVLHLFHHFPEPPPGRVLLLGAPVQGSAVARRVHSLALMRPLLGRNATGGLLEGAPPWRGGRELGVIAGTRGPGLGTLVGGLARPNDGMVALAETHLPGASATLELAVGHSGLLVNDRVAQAACRFLRQGHF